MARQKGIIKLEGTIGDITFLKTKSGYLAKEKSGVTGERIATDPAFQRTRENNAEFGRAGKASKVLRNATRTLIQKAKDGSMVGRLHKEMMRVIKADASSTRGLRNVIDGETELLQGFDFNVNAKLNATMLAPFSANIDRVTGELTITIPPFVPGALITAPGGSTHYRIVSAGIEVDFENEVFEQDLQEGAALVINDVPTALMNLSHSLPANSTHPLFLLLGIQFYQEVNGTQYPLKNGAFNALSIVKVSGV